MDSARCRCSPGVYRGDCPIHGFSSPDPLQPYALTQTDKDMLRTMRIAVTDSADIQAVRQADEDRWRERR
jgi:hypothetical protein